MYWGQVAVALVAALGSGYYFSNYGYTVVTAGFVAVCVYIGVRWLFAWIFRTRYWLRRGTGSIYHEKCPNCSVTRHRKRGDWILECHSCGWTAGTPIIRWFTKSVPAIQFRRTIVGPKLLVVILATAVVLSGATAGMTAQDVGSTVEDTASGIGSFADEAGERVDDNLDSGSDNLNQSEIEQNIHYFINEQRKQNGLNPIDFDTDLQQVARYHSENMAEDGFFAHTSPNGETIEDRYQQFGYECRVPTEGNRYLTGAENIAYTYAYADVEMNGGLESNDGNETKIAQMIVTQWMNSEGHRENILTQNWRQEGIGVYITDVDSKTRVYATQNFC